MSELRKDYLLERYVIIAEKRGKRPVDFAIQAKPANNGTCFFCPGNESLTPEEIDRIERNGKWTVRCFANKFAAVSEDSSAYGVHEVIVDTEKHGKRLSELEIGHIVDVLNMYRRRINAIEKNRRIRHVLIFKNEGEEAGASLEHSHTQLIALEHVPELITDKMNASSEYEKKHNKCAYCQVIKLEKKSGVRTVFENSGFLVFEPFASRFPFETAFFAKRHVSSITDLDKNELVELAEAMKVVLGRLDKLLKRPPYNYVLQIAPFGKDLHFHIELLPRLAKWAGFELGSNIIINTMPPEDAAIALGDPKKKRRIC